jgi:hypothetical protein
MDENSAVLYFQFIKEKDKSVDLFATFNFFSNTKTKNIIFLIVSITASSWAVRLDEFVKK